MRSIATTFNRNMKKFLCPVSKPHKICCDMIEMMARWYVFSREKKNVNQFFFAIESDAFAIIEKTSFSGHIIHTFEYG